MSSGKQKPIDWEKFEQLVSFQCTQVEIASFFDCSVDYLDTMCKRHLNCSLADVWNKKKALGRVKVKKAQMEIMEKGNPVMAIYMGKYLLGQSDAPLDRELLGAAQNSGLSREELLDIVMNAQSIAASKKKKSFEDFCVDAGYPAPYEKQVEMMLFGMDGTDVRLLLGSRGYGKTDYVVILGIAYAIYLNPKLTFLIVTKSKDRNSAIIEEIAQALLKNGSVLSRKNSSSIRVTGLLGKDNSVTALTLKSASFRGRHPYLVVMDDPVTEDDTSDATRKVAKKKYNEILKLTQNVLIIGQPAHKFDLYAELRGIIRNLEVPHGTIPELDHDLEAQRLAGVDEASIQASYHLKIMNEGTTPFDNIKYLPNFPTSESAVAFIDPSHQGGDFTAITIFKQYMQGIAVVGFVYKKAWNHCLDEMLPQLQKYNVKRLCIETNGIGDMAIDICGQVFKGIGVVGRRSNNNKHSRIMAAGTFAHLIHLSKESHKAYIEQVVQYEYNAKNDDAPDSLATGLEWIGLIRGK